MTKGTVLILIISAFATAIGQLLFKLGARGASSFPDFVNLQIISGLILYGVATTQ